MGEWMLGIMAAAAGALAVPALTASFPEPIPAIIVNEAGMAAGEGARDLPASVTPRR